MNLSAADEALARNCRFTPRLFVHTLHAGNDLGDKAGGSLVFQDHRPYFAGDDVRNIDWRAYARTDQLLLKTYQEEISPYLELLVDTSASLAVTDTKRDALIRWTWFLATVALHGGYTVTVLRLGHDRAPLQLAELNQSPWKFPASRSPTDALRRTWKGRYKSIRILLSDFLFDLDDAEAVLAATARDALALFGVQVLDHDELNPPWRGPFRLEDDDRGTTEPLHISDREAAQYLDRLGAHQQTLSRSLRRRGGAFTTVDAGAPTKESVMKALMPAGILTLG